MRKVRVGPVRVRPDLRSNCEDRVLTWPFYRKLKSQEKIRLFDWASPGLVRTGFGLGKSVLVWIGGPGPWFEPYPDRTFPCLVYGTDRWSFMHCRLCYAKQECRKWKQRETTTTWIKFRLSTFFTNILAQFQKLRRELIICRIRCVIVNTAIKSSQSYHPCKNVFALLFLSGGSSSFINACR